MQHRICTLEIPQLLTVAAQNEQLVLVTVLFYKTTLCCPGVLDNSDILVFSYSHGVAAHGTVLVLSFMVTSISPD